MLLVPPPCQGRAPPMGGAGNGVPILARKAGTIDPRRPSGPGARVPLDEAAEPAAVVRDALGERPSRLRVADLRERGSDADRAGKAAPAPIGPGNSNA